MAESEASLKKQLEDLKLKKDAVYRSVQDMTVSATKTDRAIKELAEINSMIKAIEKKLQPEDDTQARIEAKNKWLSE